MENVKFLLCMNLLMSSLIYLRTQSIDRKIIRHVTQVKEADNYSIKVLNQK